jgi:hypothetical protein
MGCNRRRFGRKCGKGQTTEQKLPPRGLHRHLAPQCA